MKLFFALGIILFSFTLGFGQNEQSPLVEKEINYKNWTYKDVQTGNDINLRDFAKGKKLTMVVYFAPWCGNWKHDAPFLQRFYDKYKANGLEMIGVGLVTGEDLVAHFAEHSCHEDAEGFLVVDDEYHPGRPQRSIWHH